MSFEIEGNFFVPDYKAKEKRLYQIIASRESEIRALQAHINDLQASSLLKDEDIGRLRHELTALKARERRRATKRKKVADEA